MEKCGIKAYGYSQDSDANIPTKKVITKFEMKLMNETSSLSSDLDDNGNLVIKRVPDNCLNLKIKIEFGAIVTLSSKQNDRLEKNKNLRKALRAASKTK